MGVLKVTISGVLGVLTGLAAGYVVWGQPIADQNWAFRKISEELATTKAWLWDEIQTSDARHEQVSASLAKALADLGNARAEIARLRGLTRPGGGAVTTARPAPTNSAQAIDALPASGLLDSLQRLPPGEAPSTPPDFGPR